MTLDVLSAQNSSHVWPAKVIHNVGGRLQLRYEGVEDDSHDFFLFYLDTRLQPLHYAEIHDYNYTLPLGMFMELFVCVCVCFCNITYSNRNISSSNYINWEMAGMLVWYQSAGCYIRINYDNQTDILLMCSNT